MPCAEMRVEVERRGREAPILAYSEPPVEKTREPVRLPWKELRVTVVVSDEPPSTRSAGHGSFVIVSTDEEKKAWDKYSKLKHVTVLSFGALLQCVLNQELDL